MSVEHKTTVKDIPSAYFMIAALFLVLSTSTILQVRHNKTNSPAAVNIVPEIVNELTVFQFLKQDSPGQGPNSA